MEGGDGRRSYENIDGCHPADDQSLFISPMMTSSYSSSEQPASSWIRDDCGFGSNLDPYNNNPYPYHAYHHPDFNRDDVSFRGYSGDGDAKFAGETDQLGVDQNPHQYMMGMNDSSNQHYLMGHPQASTMRFDGFFRNEDEYGHPLREEVVWINQPAPDDRNDTKLQEIEEAGFYGDHHQSLEQFVGFVRNDLFRYGLVIAIARDTGLLTFSPKLVRAFDDVDDDSLISTSSPKMVMSMTSEEVQKKKNEKRDDGEKGRC